MLEKPDLQDTKIIECLRNEYGLNIAQVTFLPLGADVNTAVYRVGTDDETPYFLKLRSGVFDENSVAIPRFLHEQGITHIIPIITTKNGQSCTRLEAFNVILCPYIEGQGGFDLDLSDHHWIEFGRALKRIHTAVVPQQLTNGLPRETYSPKWREIVKGFQAQVERESFADPVSVKLAALLKDKRDVISQLVERAEHLGAALQAQSLEFVVCHADIHAGNILINAQNDRIYIVDWDTLILAPKERDLMFVGGGLGGGGHTPEQEETLFYQGYGQTEVDPVALAYYRYERIVQDIAAYCEQLLLTDEGGEDREEGLRQLASQFLPHQVIDMAYRSERNLPPEFKS